MQILCQLQAFGTGGSRVDLNFCLCQELSHHFQVHVIIVYYQDMCFRCLETLSVVFPVMYFGTGCQCECSQFLIIHNILLQHNQEGGAFGIDTVDADLSAHKFHKLVDNAES